MNKIKVIENPCNLHSKKLEIEIAYYDFNTGKKSNKYINPNDVDEIVLTRGNSTISSSIFKLNPDLVIHLFNNGKPSHIILPINNLPKILKNEHLFVNLSKYKRKKLTWIFCKGVCSSRIKILSRINETRNDEFIKTSIKKMRALDLKLSKINDRNELMGIEGNIAKLFYSCLGKLNPLFNVNRDRNSKDIINSLMNLCHTILRNRVGTRLIINGVNPYHSFLHGRDGRTEQFLTWDFSEFWIPYIDKLIFYSIDRGIIKEDDICKDGRLKMFPKNKIINLINKRITNEEIDNKIKKFLGYIKGKNRFSWKV